MCSMTSVTCKPSGVQWLYTKIEKDLNNLGTDAKHYNHTSRVVSGLFLTITRSGMKESSSMSRPSNMIRSVSLEIMPRGVMRMQDTPMIKKSRFFSLEHNQSRWRSHVSRLRQATPKPPKTVKLNSPSPPSLNHRATTANIGVPLSIFRLPNSGIPRLHPIPARPIKPDHHCENRNQLRNLEGVSSSSHNPKNPVPPSGLGWGLGWGAARLCKKVH